jgi:tetratricopeptide (TPR) repeat protein
MRYWIGLVLACTIGLGMALSAAWANLDDDCYQDRNPGLAIKACSQLIRRNPRDDFAYYNRGMAYSDNGDYDRAIADFNQAMRLKPDAADAYNARGWAYFLKGDYDRVVADATKAIDIDPTGFGAYHTRGEGYRAKRDYDRAIVDFDKALALKEHIESFASRGKVHEEKGDRAKALADYNRALALTPKTKDERDFHAKARQWLAALQSAPPTVLVTPPPPPPIAKWPPPPRPVAKTPALPPVVPSAAALGRRVALVIGNAAYRIGPLQNPGNDAAAVAEMLEKRLAFDKVVQKRDLGADGFRAALRDFSRDAVGAGLALVYFAGHATERNGKNFLIPVDAKLDHVGDLSLETIPLDTVLEQIEGATKLKLVILDSCRNNIFPMAGGVRGGTRGLSRVEPGKNTLVVYAAKEGTVAADGAGRRHSPFTEALLKRILTPGLEIGYLFREVRDDVLAATAHQKEPQEPYVYGSLGSERIFLRP